MDEGLNKILDYIEDHLYEDIKLEDLSALAYYSKSHLSREFNKVLGISIPDYVTRRRLSNAAIMVFETDKKISYIANTHGFNSDKYFSFLFKKHFGIPPSKYRNKTSYILLYPKRHLKGGERTKMKKLEDLTCDIIVGSTSNKEYTVTVDNLEIKGNEVKSTIELQDNGNVKVAFYEVSE